MMIVIYTPHMECVEEINIQFTLMILCYLITANVQQLV